MFSELFLTMSLSGSIVFLLYALTSLLAKNYVSLRWRYRMLKIAAAFYLLPLPWFKYLILDALHFCFPLLGKGHKSLAGTVNMTHVVMVASDFVKVSPSVRRMLMVVFTAWLVSLALAQWSVIQYRKWKSVRDAGAQSPLDWEEELFMRVKKELGIKKNVQFFQSPYCSTPMVSGIWHAVVVVPEWGETLETEQYEYVLRHELFHIKHRDLLIRYIGLFIVAVHWYNPFAYAMLHEISAISEMYCDSFVIGEKGEDARKKYSDLLLTLATRHAYTKKERFFAGMANSRKKQMYKRRILEMKKHMRHKVILSVFLTMFLCISGVATTLAYEPPRTILDFPEKELGGEFVFIEGTGEAKKTELPSESFFMDDRGDVFDLSHSDEKRKAVCIHDFSIHGTWNAHKKDGAGGCKVSVYDARLCSKCSAVKIGALKSVTTYPSCPHK